MCGIIGFFNTENSFNYAIKALKAIKNRGKDGFGIANENEVKYSKKINLLKLKNPLKHKNKTNISPAKNHIAHCLHSVVKNIPQPLESSDKEKRFLIAINCEIYNWEELNRKYKLNAKNDSEMLLRLIIKKGINKKQTIEKGTKKGNKKETKKETIDIQKNIEKTLTELDGVYAFSLWDRKQEKVYLARDIIGVKPVFYSLKNGIKESFNNGFKDSLEDCSKGGFSFASERKALEKADISSTSIEELNPRTILVYDINKNKLKKIKREFFSIKPEHKASAALIKKRVKSLLKHSIKKRVPKRKFAVLFSGGIDSTIIAFILKELGCRFTCYTAALKQKGMQEAEDVVYARKIAKELGFKHKVVYVSIKQAEKYLKEVVPLIETSHVVKVAVALTFFAACKQAQKDKIKVIFSGLGAEEIFSGYERHKRSTYLNKECLSGVLRLYEKDLYRDDVVTMNNNIELRVPFLDKDLVDYALKIPVKYKINKKGSKIILRQIAKELGLKEEYAFRKKKAAQYGSKFDKAIKKLSKSQGLRLKSEYLNRFAESPNLKVGVLFSSGKDSAYAAYVIKRQNYDLSCLINVKSKNPDSYMYHTPNVELVGLQAKAMGLPLVQVESAGEKETELKELKQALIKAKKEYAIQGVVTGALYSNYQRERVERICDELDLKIFSPLWHMKQYELMKLLIREKFEIIFSSIAAEGLDKSWLGRVITLKDLEKLEELNKKIGLNVAGEGGEFESLVIDCPLFKKKIGIVDSEIMMETNNTGKYIIKKAVLVDK